MPNKECREHHFFLLSVFFLSLGNWPKEIYNIAQSLLPIRSFLKSGSGFERPERKSHGGEVGLFEPHGRKVVAGVGCSQLPLWPWPPSQQGPSATLLPLPLWAQLALAAADRVAQLTVSPLLSASGGFKSQV